MDLLLKKLLEEIKNNKFKIIVGCTNYKFTYKIKNDKRYEQLYKWFLTKYIIEGRGLKSMIKDFNLPVTYSFIRGLFKFMNIKIREPNKANDFLRKRRSQNANKQYKEKIGFFSPEVQEKIKIKNKITKGIQGYYWNESRKKYVWLRSSWEFIYAKWLNKQNVKWDVEKKEYKFINEEGNEYKYKPDFFIYEEGDLKKIIEIKGYWKDKLYKFNRLREELLGKDVDVILITDIIPYCESNINNEIKLWKKLRRLELKT